MGNGVELAGDKDCPNITADIDSLRPDNVLLV